MSEFLRLAMQLIGRKIVGFDHGIDADGKTRSIELKLDGGEFVGLSISDNGNGGPPAHFVTGLRPTVPINAFPLDYGPCEADRRK